MFSKSNKLKSSYHKIVKILSEVARTSICPSVLATSDKNIVTSNTTRENANAGASKSA